MREGSPFVAAHPRQRIHLRFRDPSYKLHEPDAGVVDIMIGPARRERGNGGTPEVQKAVKRQRLHRQGQVDHAPTSTSAISNWMWMSFAEVIGKSSGRAVCTATSS